jgi:biotin-dependent carboxylase-like uncharacterized protein
MSLLLETPGLLTTVQASPRAGWQHLGIGPSGPMDPTSHRLSNLLVGNAPDAATLEITLLGPRIRCERDHLVALVGADLGALVDGRPVPLGRPLRLRQGATLSFGAAASGSRVYLALGGGISLPRVLGSRATDLRGRFGGVDGRPVQAGQRLFAGVAPDPYPSLQPTLGQAWVAAPWRPDPSIFPERPHLRLVPGPHLDLVGRGVLEAASFTLNPRSDRQGLRLLGRPLELARTVECLTEGVAFGTVQLPPDGLPILLMADRQSTGGYPRLGEIYSVDLGRAAQLRPGDPVRFQVGSLAEARSKAWALEGWFRQVADFLEARRG